MTEKTGKQNEFVYNFTGRGYFNLCCKSHFVRVIYRELKCPQLFYHGKFLCYRSDFGEVKSNVHLISSNSCLRRVLSRGAVSFNIS